jgi:2-methylcitrate dehydratase PrpD
MCALQTLVTEHGLEADDIEQIYAGTNRHMPTALIHHRPTNSLEAKFSMEYCLAIVAIAEDVGLPQFTDDRVLAPDVQRMLRRVEFVEDPSVDLDYDKMNTLLRVTTKGGRTIESMAQYAKGSPSLPLSWSELVGKFERNLAWGGITDTGRYEPLVASLNEIETVSSVRDVVDQLVTVAREEVG